jgi:23S rRNA (cytosine1962-C5)-methyltransferase
MKMVKIILKKGKEESLLRRHPWIFSGAIHRIESAIEEGDLVEIMDAKGQFLAIGYYSDGSIAVRVLSFEPTVVDTLFWKQKIEKAYVLRQKIALTDSKSTNCYRLIHAEGDEISGLIIDIYNTTAVVQCHAIGIHRLRNDIKNALLEVYQNKIISIYDKSAETLPPLYVKNLNFKNEYLHGSVETPQNVLENDHTFAIDWVTGQKTGFFLDQRNNRQLLSAYVRDKTVLNAFCYSGGFSVYALKAGAKHVESVDISPKAIDLTTQNVALNAPFTGTHEARAEDVLTFFKNQTQKYEVIIVDPPAFAKSMAKRHNAVQAYKRLNIMALRALMPSGILFTFSCSQVVDIDLFYNTIVAAAMETNRSVRLIHRLTQPADHPVSLFHPEGAYLKGLVLYVE